MSHTNVETTKTQINLNSNKINPKVLHCKLRDDFDVRQFTHAYQTYDWKLNYDEPFG